MDLTLSNLVRTMQTRFQIGIVRLKDSSGVMQMRNAADSAYVALAALNVRVQGSNATNAVVLAAPAALGSDLTITLPPDVGASGYVLQTDGAGTTVWAAVTTNSDLVQVESFTEATSSPLTIFTPPANAILTDIVIDVSVAAGGGSPTVSVGVSGTVARDMATTENDLKTVGRYQANPDTAVGGSPAAVILTIVPSSQTFTGKVYVKYTNPA